jgi:Fe-S cluster biosynthesis and repair protein YggX
MDVEKRIAQFENMAQADPSNEMAHFSLGKAYADAGRFADASQSYLRCVQLVPDMSKAYQLAGEMLIKVNQNDEAASILVRGYVVAAEKGDLMPKTAMANLLKQLGREVPEVPNAKGASASVPLGGVGGSAANYDPSKPLPEGMILDKKTGRPGTRMPRPPFKGPVGAWIAANISQETFYKGWVPQGTKVINELRLDLSREKDQEIYDQHMREYLGVDESVLKQAGV